MVDDLQTRLCKLAFEHRYPPGRAQIRDRQMPAGPEDTMDLLQKSGTRGIRMGRLDVDYDVDRRGGSWNIVGPTAAPLRVRKLMMSLAPCNRPRRDIDACVRPRVALAQEEGTAPATTAT